MKSLLQSNIRKHNYLIICVSIFIIYFAAMPQNFIASRMASSAASQEPSFELQSKTAEALHKLGIIAGYEDGSLHIEYPIRRSEFSTLVVKLMGYEEASAKNTAEVSFKDVPEWHWAYPYIQAAFKAEYIKGYPDGSFAPDNRITYAEAITVLTKAIGYNGTPSMEWPGNFINKAKEIQLLKNIELTPDHAMTRGEICILLYNSLTVDFHQ